MIYHKYVWPGARFGQHAAFYCSPEIMLKFSYGTGRRVNVTVREPLTRSCCKFKPGEKTLWSTEASSATAPSLPRSVSPLHLSQGTYWRTLRLLSFQRVITEFTSLQQQSHHLNTGSSNVGVTARVQTYFRRFPSPVRFVLNNDKHFTLPPVPLASLASISQTISHTLPVFSAELLSCLKSITISTAAASTVHFN